MDNLTVSIQVIIFLMRGYSVIQGNLSVGQNDYYFALCKHCSLIIEVFFHLGKKYSKITCILWADKSVIDMGTETNGFSTITEINKIEQNSNFHIMKMM